MRSHEPTSFLALATIWALVVISPGPCFVAVVQQTTRGTRRHGVLTASGIAVGTIIWCLGSLLGLALLFTTFTWLYNIVRFAGQHIFSILVFKLFAVLIVHLQPNSQILQHYQAGHRGVQVY